MVDFYENFGVSTDQYLARMDGGIYGCYEDVPGTYRSVMEPGYNGMKSNYDYEGLLSRGKSWVIGPLEILQPYSFSAFNEAAGELLLGIVLIKDLMNPGGPPMVRPILFFDASGRMVQVQANFPGSTYEEGDDSFGSLLSLPDALAKSWLWRTAGWRMPGEPFQGPLINRCLIGHPSSMWLDADNYLDTLGKGAKKKFLPKIVDLFPDTVVEPKGRYGIRRYKFRCFLDTRPAGVGGPVGDQFFVCSTRRDQVVYHIHRGDINDIRVLRDPGDAIDRYCAHVLRRLPGEFDFSRWSEPMLA
ncbi:hypothetical protein [Pseudoxanthomonas composti]|uniref:Uncharacterized protein n=1 Tax=Pseudoxanthomonas composti TaxID=2137479 RepID=A0A4Q1K0U1_9GAMM|nr:hypothetical protein [Pseudoxanthomonas composti]RXR08661.1 hypothetical protein EPA99_02250 [Pseudoxanthomonas composti]